MRGVVLRGGLAGWLVALVPLAAVNVVSALGLLDYRDTLTAGGLALLGAIVLGGGVAGALAGRGRWALASGGVTALLLVLTMVVLEVVAAATEIAPPLVADTTNVRDMALAFVAILFAATLLVLVALAAGAWRGAGRDTRVAARGERGAAMRAAGAYLPPRSGPAGYPGSPAGYRHPPGTGMAGDAQPGRPGSVSGPRWADPEGRGGYGYGSQPRPDGASRPRQPAADQERARW